MFLSLPEDLVVRDEPWRYSNTMEQRKLPHLRLHVFWYIYQNLSVPNQAIFGGCNWVTSLKEEFKIHKVCFF